MLHQWRDLLTNDGKLNTGEKNVSMSYQLLSKVSRFVFIKLIFPIAIAIRKSKFVIISQGRSGSTYLNDLLNDHPRLSSYGEFLLLEDFKGIISYFYTFLQRKASPSKFSKTNFYESDVIGFKLLYYQLDKNPDLLNFFKKRRVSVLHLIRKNFIRRHLSLVIAFNNNKFFTFKEENLKKVVVNCKKILSEMDSYSTEIKILSKRLRGQKRIIIYYEDLCKNKNKELGKIQKFLGVSVEKLSSNLIKQNPFLIKEMVENYDELEKTLRGTKYYWMLDSD